MKQFVMIAITTSVTVSFAAENDTIISLERIVVNSSSSQSPSIAPLSVERRLTENSAVTLIKRGPSAAEPVVRGSSGNDILITLDGARVQSACTDRMDPLTSYISDNILAGLDVDAGSHGLLTGAPPLGKVNLILKRAQPGTQKLKWNLGGQVSTIDSGLAGNGSIAWKSPLFAVDLTASARRVEDYSDPEGSVVSNSGLRTANLFATSTLLAGTNTRLRTTMLYDKFWNAGYPALPMDVGFSELIHGAVGIVQFWQNGSLDALLYANRTEHAMDDTHRKNIAMHMDMPGSGSTFGGWFVLQKLASSQILSMRLEGWHSTQSASMTMYDTYNAPSMYLETWPLTVTLGVTSSVSDEFWLTDIWQAHGALIVENRFLCVESEVGKRQIAMLQPAASVEKNFISPGFQTGIRFVPSPNNELGISLSGSQRIPAMDELYGFYLFNTATNRDYLGNVKLSPEKVYQAELTGKINTRKILNASGAVWSTLKKDVIEAIDVPDISPMTAGAYGVRQWSNRGNEWRVGVESDIRIKLCAYLELHSIARYIYGKAFLNCHIPQVQSTGGTVSIIYRLSLINIAAELDWAPTQNRLDPMFTVTKSTSYIVPHLRLSGQISGKVKLQWRAGIENILNQKWRGNQDWDNFITKKPLYQPGRNFNFDLSFQG